MSIRVRLLQLKRSSDARNANPLLQSRESEESESVECVIAYTSSVTLEYDIYTMNAVCNTLCASENKMSISHSAMRDEES